MQVDTAALLVRGSRRTGSSRTLCKGRRNVSQMFLSEYFYFLGQESSGTSLDGNLPVENHLFEREIFAKRRLLSDVIAGSREKETRERKTGRSLISEKFKIFFIRCSKEIASRPRMLVTSRWPFLTSGSHDRNVVLNIKLPATSRVFA